jgi:NADH-quinone oxidoreductase subunit F
MERYLATGGYDGLKKALAMSPEAMSGEVKASTLLGRGGAGFPAGVKWGFTPQGVWPRYLVVNGDESEPGTYKDRLLMERDPHQLIEGCLIACYAAGLAQCFLYVRGEMALAHERIAAALNDAYAAGYVGKNIMGTDFSVDIVLHWGAGAYVVGEETALIESLEGERGMPRLKPPYFPAAIGLYGQPTIVNNVETLANLPFIASNGSAAFTAVGTETSPGTRMVAISGHVKRPGVYEIVNGSTTFRDIIYGDEFCQGIRDDNELKAFVPGGGSAPWFVADQLDIPFEGREAGAAGSMLGSGAVMVMDSTTDIPEAALTLTRFYAHESCGKCVPCREGGTWLLRILERICSGHGTDTDLEQILEVGQSIGPGDMPHASSERLGLAAVPFPYKMTTICFVGPSAYAPLHSALTLFPEEFAAKVTAAPKRISIPVAAAGS